MMGNEIDTLVRFDVIVTEKEKSHYERKGGGDEVEEEPSMKENS